MEGIGRAALALSLLIVAASATGLILSDDSSAPPTLGPVDDYPEADYIISDAGRSYVLITYKVYAEDGTAGWESRRVANGSVVTLAQLSDCSGYLSVVMVGGTLGTLTLIQADQRSVDDTVEVSFDMYGGTLGTLKVMTPTSGVSAYLSDSYTLTYQPLGDVWLNLSSGDIGEVIPTEHMIAASSLEVYIGDGTTIDRMMTSGENGRYDSVSVTLDGGSVGYMTNKKSVVGSLQYRFVSGTVEYFCIGADTESGSNSSLRSMSTFYVQGDVYVRIDPQVSIRQAIIGGGIVSLPSSLWNGDVITASPAKNVEIDAPGTPIAISSCFIPSNRTQGTAYQFSTYTLGGTPRTRVMSSEFYTSSGYREVYGDRGIWESARDLTLPTGYYMFLCAELSVPSGSHLSVSEGASLTNTGHITLYGSMVSEGRVINGGVIEKREGGTYTGTEIQGEGYVAYCINVSPNDGSIDVMSADDDAVILRSDESMTATHMSVILRNSESSVDLSCSGGGFQVNGLMIGFRAVEAGDFEAAYELTIQGIDQSVLASTTIEVMFTLPSGQSGGYVYYEGEDGGIRQAEVTDVSYGRLTFIAPSAGVYYYSSSEGDFIESGYDRMLNIYLASAIVIVGAVVVYALLKKD